MTHPNRINRSEKELTLGYNQSILPILPMYPFGVSKSQARMHMDSAHELPHPLKRMVLALNEVPWSPLGYAQEFWYLLEV